MELHSQSQSIVESSRLYHDLNSLSKLRGKLDDDAATKEAAKQFESMFYSMMMKSMRDASKAINPDPMFQSPSMDLFQDMYDKQLSLEFGTSQAGALGLADILVNQLTGEQLPTSSPVSPIDWSATKPVQIRLDSKLASVKQDVKAERSDTNISDIKEQQSSLNNVTATENTTEAITEKGLDYSSPAAFVSSLLPYARKFAQKLNVDPKVLIAQAALETGWGKFVMRTADGVSSNNLFGIKADESWQGEQSRMQTLEFESGELRKKVAAFKAYHEPDQSFADYVDLISSKPRYDKALKASGSPVEYLQQLQKAGYATDPNYAEKIHEIYRSDTLNKAIHDAEQQTMGIAR